MPTKNTPSGSNIRNAESLDIYTNLRVSLKLTNRFCGKMNKRLIGLQPKRLKSYFYARICRTCGVLHIGNIFRFIGRCGCWDAFFLYLAWAAASR